MIRKTDKKCERDHNRKLKAKTTKRQIGAEGGLRQTVRKHGAGTRKIRGINNSFRWGT